MITVAILTKDNQETLRNTLESVKKFPEIIIYDTGSQDRTLEIAKEFSSVKIYQGKFNGFGPTKQTLMALATYDWILSLDSDEVLSEPLLKEISSLTLDPDYVYSFPFKNFFKNKWIKRCGWYPDRHIRLFSRSRASFDSALVHEGLKTQGLKEFKCQSPVFHYSYRSFNDFLRKSLVYSTLFAEQYEGKKKSSFAIAFFHSFAAFFKSYLLKRGFLDGASGFIICSYQAHVTFYKYLKLAEKNRCF